MTPIDWTSVLNTFIATIPLMVGAVGLFIAQTRRQDKAAEKVAGAADRVAERVADVAVAAAATSATAQATSDTVTATSLKMNEVERNTNHMREELVNATRALAHKRGHDAGVRAEKRTARGVTKVKRRKTAR